MFDCLSLSDQPRDPASDSPPFSESTDFLMVRTLNAMYTWFTSNVPSLPQTVHPQEYAIAAASSITVQTAVSPPSRILTLTVGNVVPTMYVPIICV